MKNTKKIFHLTKLFIKWKMISTYTIKDQNIFIKPLYKNNSRLWSSIRLNYSPSLKQTLTYSELSKNLLNNNNNLLIISTSNGFFTNLDLIKGKKKGGIILYTINF